jgi:hypothetical protein
MTPSTIPGVSAGHPFLKGLSEPHLARLVPAAHPFSAAPGECLTRDGEPADAFYLIQAAGRTELDGDGAPRGATHAGPPLGAN